MQPWIAADNTLDYYELEDEKTENQGKGLAMIAPISLERGAKRPNQK
jgi:hypothetical protein